MRAIAGQASSATRKRDNDGTAVLVPWRERALQTLPAASEISGVSVASLYQLEKSGALVFKRLAGRTLVQTVSLIELVDSAEDWAPSVRANQARAARAVRSRAAWQD